MLKKECRIIGWGLVPEREVSLTKGKAVESAEAGYDVTCIDVTKMFAHWLRR